MESNPQLYSRVIAVIKTLSYRFDLVGHLTRRSFFLRYEGSTLGILWSLVPSLFQLSVIVFLFKTVVPLNIEAYPAFVFAALLPWNWFSGCVGSAAHLFSSHRDLVRRPKFDPANLVVVEALSLLGVYLLSLPILFFLLALYGRNITASMMTLPLLILIQFVLIVGLGLMIATLNVFYRDVSHIVNVILTLLFYLTPVFYQVEKIPAKFRLLYRLNPMAVVIESYRAIFLYGTFPEWDALALAAIISFAILGVGYLVYKARSDEVVDML